MVVAAHRVASDTLALNSDALSPSILTGTNPQPHLLLMSLMLQKHALCLCVLGILGFKGDHFIPLFIKTKILPIHSLYCKRSELMHDVNTVSVPIKI